MTYQNHLTSLLFLSLGWLSFHLSAGENGSQREVILENEQTQVVRLTYPPGTESGMHTHIHPKRSVYFVKGGKLELIPQDVSKPSTIIDMPEGKILFLPATTHNVKNIGKSTVILLEHEFKQ